MGNTCSFFPGMTNAAVVEDALAAAADTGVPEVEDCPITETPPGLLTPEPLFAEGAVVEAVVAVPVVDVWPRTETCGGILFVPLPLVPLVAPETTAVAVPVPWATPVPRTDTAAGFWKALLPELVPPLLLVFGLDVEELEEADAEVEDEPVLPPALVFELLPEVLEPPVVLLLELLLLPLFPVLLEPLEATVS
jgi:hypothetical protein